MSEFKFFDRGQCGTTLLIPGWATDYRIFDTLNLKTNYLMPIKFSPFDFDEDLIAAVKRYKLGKISIIGWSIGGFAASRFLSGYRDHVNDVTLVSVRRKYERKRIEDIRGYLKKNRAAFLYTFYKDCFSRNEKREFAWFRDNLLKDYLDRIGLESLFEGLDYLSESEIKPEALHGAGIRFVHGREDRIAPIKEVLELKEGLADATLVAIDGSGHMPFLNPAFKEIFSGEHSSYR